MDLRARRRRCTIGLVIALWVVVGVGPTPVPVAPAAATATTAADAAIVAVVAAGDVETTGPSVAAEPEAVDPPGVRRGPDPTGQAVPTTRQRIIDSAVWLWLLACLGVAVVLVVRIWQRVPDDSPLLDDPDRSDPSAGVEAQPDRH